MEKQGVITPVQFSDWAAPIVPVIKRDETVQIYGNYQLTINKAAKLEVYLLSCIEDLLASLASGKTFTKLDLFHPYFQVKLDEESKKYVTVNTHGPLSVSDFHLELHQLQQFFSGSWREPFARVT